MDKEIIELFKNEPKNRVTAVQFLHQLSIEKITETAVKKVLNKLKATEKAKFTIIWERSTFFERDSEIVEIIAKGFKLSDEKMNEIFTKAKKL
jgi:hypothetical protein